MHSDAAPAGATDVAVSVVICTRERAARLSRTLESYERLRFEHLWELIVVVNASVDGTAAVVEQFRRRTTLPLVMLHEPVPGVCGARNLGWRRSRGRIVAFVDDDCYPAEDYLHQLLDCFGDGRVGFLGGRMALFDARDLPLSVHYQTGRRELPPRSLIEPGVIHGGNMVFRRDVLEAIDGFDTRMGAGTPVRSAGDSDAVSRASAAGFAGCYEPRAIVYHHHGRQSADEGRRVRAGYAIGRGAFMVKCLLDPRRRPIYARWIGEHLREHARERRYALFGHEARGALAYLAAVGMRLPRRG